MNNAIQVLMRTAETCTRDVEAAQKHRAYLLEQVAGCDDELKRSQQALADCRQAIALLEASAERPA